MLGYRQKFFAWTALAFCAASAARGASSSASYVLSASVRGSAGAVSVSTSKRMLSAAGQSGVGTFSSSAYVLKLGFIREAVAVNPTTQYYTPWPSKHGTGWPFRRRVSIQISMERCWRIGSSFPCTPAERSWFVEAGR